MGGSVNKAILIGNLSKDPELKFTAGGQAVCNFTIATNESWNDKSGAKQERVEWHRIVAWGKLAEICGEYLSKGRTVYLEGRIQTREWTDKEGNRKFTTEIVARDVQFLGGKDGGGGGGRSKPSGDSGGNAPPPPGFESGGDDSIPF